LRTFPGERMFATAGTDYQYIHAAARVLVAEMAHAGKDHSEAVFIGCLDDFVVAH
jgi:hypothetical protein